MAAPAIPPAEVSGVLVPAIASMLDRRLKDTTTPSATRATIQAIFDANKDGTLSDSEAASNPLIKTFLAGDVDVDSDGVEELSLGLGFTAVGAVIQP